MITLPRFNVMRSAACRRALPVDGGFIVWYTTNYFNVLDTNLTYYGLQP